MHGIGMTGHRTKAEQAKWQVGYHDKWGGCGHVGWVALFDHKEDALAFGEKLKAEKSYITDVFVFHPSAIYSAY